MTQRLPSLNALKAFEAAARHASFSRAADELGVSHAAISRHIRELEGRLGQKLFHRTGRGVELTDAATAYAGELSAAFSQIVKATSRAMRQRAVQQLVITCEVPFATLWLVPRLGRFTAKHPGIDLVIDPSDRLADLNRNEADLGIRYGRGRWRGVICLKLADTQLYPVCSPAVWHRLGGATPADLANATLLREEDKEHWTRWLDAVGVGALVRPSGPTLLGPLAVSAAEAGQGFAIGDDITAGDALLARRLVRPFKRSIRHHAYYLVRGEARPENRATAAFRRWIVDEIEATTVALRALPEMRQQRPA